MSESKEKNRPGRDGSRYEVQCYQAEDATKPVAEQFLFPFMKEFREITRPKQLKGYKARLEGEVL